jgi:ABC-type glycerol-3-phosphate transport system permease component
MATIDLSDSSTDVAAWHQRGGKERLVGYHRLRAIVNTVLAAVLGVVFVWPFLCIVGTSFNRMDVWMNPLLPIPAQFSTKLYELMVTKYGFHRYIWNSVVVVFTSTALSVFASSLAGYALAKCEFPGRNILFTIILAIMMLPGQTMIVSQFVIMRQLKLVNNYWGLILPAVGGGAGGIFLMRQFMLGVPTEMLEAARIDGSSEFGLFLKIVLPTMKAPLGVMTTLSLQGGWNALLWPQILITDEAKMLLMPAIARLNNLSVADPYARPVVWAAAITGAILPLALYAYSQKNFVSAMAGAVKM